MLAVALIGMMAAFVVADVAGAFDEAADDDDQSGVSPEDADILVGTDMLDVIRGGDGDDQIRGEAGDDMLYGEGGNDAAFGGPGNDQVFLGEGNDVAVGESAGDDSLRGGAGNDIIRDDQGSNMLYGDAGDDTLDAIDLDGYEGIDSLFGGAGDDYLTGDAGDVLTGGEDDDMFIIAESEVGADPVVIADAEAGETICLVVPEANTTDTIVTQVGSNGTDLEVVFRDEVLAILQGRTTADDLTLQLAPNIFNG